MTSTSSSSAMNSMAVSSVWIVRRGELDAVVVASACGCWSSPSPAPRSRPCRRAGRSRRPPCPRRRRRPGRRTARRGAGGCRARSRVAVPERSASMAPPVRWGSSPAHGVQPAWCWWSSAVPRVAVSSSERNPMRPRAGASNVTIVRPGSPGRRSSDPALAGGEGLGDGADVLVGHVAHAPLERLVAVAVDLLGDDLGPADLQLVALAPHRLDQHGQLQLAPAGHLDDVGRVGVLEADRDVAEDLARRGARAGGGR